MLFPDLSLTLSQRRRPCVLDPGLMLSRFGLPLIRRPGELVELWMVRELWHVLDNSQFERNNGMSRSLSCVLSGRSLSRLASRLRPRPRTRRHLPLRLAHALRSEGGDRLPAQLLLGMEHVPARISNLHLRRVSRHVRPASKNNGSIVDVGLHAFFTHDREQRRAQVALQVAVKLHQNGARRAAIAAGLHKQNQNN
jgi:hypothetical protein